MPSIVLTDASIVAGAHTLSPQVLGVTLNYEVGAVPETAMGQTTEANKGGVFKWGGSISFKQDYADDGVDEDVFGLIGTTATLVAKPTSAATGPNNPAYTGSALFTGTAPLNAQHGELVKSTLSFVSAGPLTRVIA